MEEGDVVELVMDMPVRLLEAHPLAEEIRNRGREAYRWFTVWKVWILQTGKRLITY